MKNRLQKVIIQLCIITILFYSCKKDLTYSEGNDLKIVSINAWLTKQENSKQPNRSNNIEILKKYLRFSEMHEDFDKRGSTLVIPIDTIFRTIGKMELGSILNLVALINKDGTIRDAFVAVYTPTKDQSISTLPKNTFNNIFHTAKDITDGKYRFLSPAGTRRYEVEYRNGYLYSEGRISKTSAAVLVHGTAAITLNDVKTNSVCIDWYLVTTYYYADGTSTQTSEYEGTTCDGCDNGMYESLCPNDGGGTTPEMHVAKIYNRTWLFCVENDLGLYKTNSFTIDDDYFIVGLGFGPIGKSNTDPTNAVVEEIIATATASADFTLAFTYCKAKITYPADPSNPIVRDGSRDWTVPSIKNP